MDLRLALLQLTTQYELTDTQHQRLTELAGFQTEPPDLARGTAFGVAVLGAVLGGLGVIFWIAANWSDFGRAGRFAMLQGLVVATCVGAWARPAARVPLGLLAMLGIGALFAYFGQTYQTGADPWQLFAWWFVLGLPLCLGVRHDALWAAWTLVAATAITLWVHAATGRSWSVAPGSLPVFFAGWSAALLMTFAFSPAWRRYTGAGIVSMRVAVLLAVLMITVSAVGGLFSHNIEPHFWLGSVMIIAAAAALSQRRFYDLFALSSVALALNVLAFGLLVTIVVDDNDSNLLAALVMLGLLAAGMLAGTVSFVLGVSRRYATAEAAA